MQIMNLNKKQNYILNIVQKDPGLGKTALMKVIFMLQEVMGVKTEYDFSIYTYGPYDTNVMEDIDELCARGLITCSMYPYQTYIGYSLDITDTGKHSLHSLSDKEDKALENIVHFAKNKNAKELELYSTIIYVDKLFKKNSWPADNTTIINKVKEIKPHFSEDMISTAFSCLQEKRYI